MPKKKKQEERKYAKDRMEYFREFHQVIAPVVVLKQYDDKVNEFKTERENLSSQLNAFKNREIEMPRNTTPPKTMEELEEFKKQYPDVFDVVQTGVGITGKMRAQENFLENNKIIRPDIISFGKKSQVCGVLAGDRILHVSVMISQII